MTTGRCCLTKAVVSVVAKSDLESGSEVLSVTLVWMSSPKYDDFGVVRQKTVLEVGDVAYGGHQAGNGERACGENLFQPWRTWGLKI